MRAPFVVVEGLDRSGKSTQCKKLAQNFLATNQCFPDRSTTIGKTIDCFLNKEFELPPRATHLLFTLNRWEKQDFIRDSTSEEHAVFCDRYSYSGIAYSVAAQGLERGWCSAVENGLFSPDITLFFHVTPAVAAARGGYGLERYEKQEIQDLVRLEYDHLGKTESNWNIVDASNDLETVFETAERILSNHMVQDKPLGFLNYDDDTSEYTPVEGASKVLVHKERFSAESKGQVFILPDISKPIGRILSMHTENGYLEKLGPKAFHLLLAVHLWEMQAEISSSVQTEEIVHIDISSLKLPEVNPAWLRAVHKGLLSAFKL